MYVRCCFTKGWLLKNKNRNCIISCNIRFAMKNLFYISCIFLLWFPLQTFSQWSSNPTINTPICTATGAQSNPKIVADDSGGAIITWEDHRNNWDIYAQHVNAFGIVQWTTNGVAICTAKGDQTSPTIVSDGAGGAIIAWQDGRSEAGDIYAQRVNASGVSLWTANGVLICGSMGGQGLCTIVSDDVGGAIIAWRDQRSDGGDIYAQRVSASGTVQWTANGVAICTTPNYQQFQVIVGDGLGGAIITWEDVRSGDFHIYAQRINASGIVQWTANGVAICTAANQQRNPTIVSDSTGGAIISWHDNRNGNYHIYAQRISTAGLVQWATDGVAICTGTGDQGFTAIASDNSGGAIITWHDGLVTGPRDIYAQRVLASGIVQWTTNGVAVCIAANNQQLPAIMSDGAGGGIITWFDHRNDNWDIYAQRIDSLGAVQWAINGVAVSTAPNEQYFPNLVGDRVRGPIITWQDYRRGYPDSCDIYIQRVGNNGILGGISTFGLAAYYPFNGNVNDESGNNLNGINHGATLIADRFGYSNSAYGFDGTNNYIELPDTILAPTSPEITLSIWVKADTDIKWNDPHIFFKMKTGVMAIAYYKKEWMGSVSDSIRIGVKLSNGYWYNTLMSIARNNWYHVVGVYRRGIDLTVWVNGQKGRSLNLPSLDIITGDNLLSSLGRYQLSSDRFFKGAIDDFIIYNRALSEGEIIGLYRGWSELNPPITATSPASSITSSGATMNGSVNPNGLSTNVWFEWGTSNTLTMYDSTTEQSIGSGTSAVGVSTSLNSLNMGATYYYRIAAQNAGGRVKGIVQNFTTALPPYPSMFTLNDSLSFPTHPNAGDYTAGDYRIIGLPGNGNLPLTNFLTGESRTDWKIYWDNGQPANYLEYYNGSSVFQCTTGRAFWVLSKSKFRINVTVPSAPLDIGKSVNISLHSGWNLITNPFPAPIPWTIVQTLNLITDSIYMFDHGFKASSSFDPFIGYYLFNSQNLISLRVPWAGVFTPSITVETQEAVNWKVNIVMTSGTTTDRSVWLGVLKDAANTLDRFKQRKPRAVDLLPSIFFNRPSWDHDYPTFTSDFRNVFADSCGWEFKVQTDRKTPVRLDFKGISSIPVGLEIFLIDRSGSRYADIRKDSIYNFTGVLSVYNFEVVIGKHDLIMNRLKSVVPQDFSLGNAFPNPFNPSTTVPLRIPYASEVTLSVYNLLGQGINIIYEGKLDAGQYWFIWDPQKVNRARLSSGVYIIQLKTSDGFKAAKKVILMK